MNNANLVGRLTREPDLKYTQNGKAVVRFTLAVNRPLSKEKKEEAERNNYPTADFISCQAWGKTAETIANYVKRGQRIGVTGHIQTGRYDDKDGKTVYTTDVVVDAMEFLESANNNNNYNSDYKNADEGMYQINNEDIPF